MHAWHSLTTFTPFSSKAQSGFHLTQASQKPQRYSNNSPGPSYQCIFGFESKIELSFPHRDCFQRLSKELLPEGSSLPAPPQQKLHSWQNGVHLLASPITVCATGPRQAWIKQSMMVPRTSFPLVVMPAVFYRRLAVPYMSWLGASWLGATNTESQVNSGSQRSKRAAHRHVTTCPQCFIVLRTMCYNPTKNSSGALTTKQKHMYSSHPAWLHSKFQQLYQILTFCKFFLWMTIWIKKRSFTI